MEAIRGSSNLAQPAHMISHRDVNQKWLSIWRGGERHCQLVTTWLVCTGQEWSLFEYGSCRDRISPELSYQSVPWLITGIASELLGIREGGSFSKPQNENYDLVHPLWWCGYIHKHLFSLTLAGTQRLLLGGCAPVWEFPFQHEIRKLTKRKGCLYSLWINNTFENKTSYLSTLNQAGPLWKTQDLSMKV